MLAILIVLLFKAKKKIHVLNLILHNPMTAVVRRRHWREERVYKKELTWEALFVWVYLACKNKTLDMHTCCQTKSKRTWNIELNRFMQWLLYQNIFAILLFFKFHFSQLLQWRLDILLVLKRSWVLASWLHSKNKKQKKKKHTNQPNTQQTKTNLYLLLK